MSVVANKYTKDVDEVTCDLCGHQDSPSEQWGFLEYGNMKSGALQDRKDLCPDCLRKLVAFLQESSPDD